MRAFFLFAVGATLGLITGLLLVTIEPFDGGGEGPPGPVIGVGIGEAGIWISEDAAKKLLVRELPLQAPIEGPAVAVVDIMDDGHIAIELNALTSEDELPTTLTLNPELVDGMFELLVVDFTGGTPEGATLVAQIIDDEVQAMLTAPDNTPRYKLAAITTTNDRLTIEVNLVD